MTIVGVVLHWTQANSFELMVCQNMGWVSAECKNGHLSS